MENLNFLADMANKGLWQENSSPDYIALCLAIKYRTPVIFGTGRFEPKGNSLAAATIWLDNKNFATEIGVDKAVAVDEGLSNNYWRTLPFPERCKLINKEIMVYGIKTKKTRFEVIWMHVK